MLLVCLILSSSALSVVAQTWITLGTDPAGEPLRDETADAEQQDPNYAYGSNTAGTYQDTWTSNDVRETLTEGKSGANYRLGWVYTFSSLSVRTDTKFSIEGRLGSTNPESMTVSWSTSINGPWNLLVTISSTTESTYGPYDITSDTSTTLYIQIKDTDSSEKLISSIDIDYMFFRCSFGQVDKTGCYFRNDGTYAYFKENLVAASDASSFTYTVYLDKPSGGTYSQDYRMVYSSGTAKLQKWNGASWQDQGSITVEIGTSPDSITFQVALADIANPDIQQDTNVWFEEYLGANSFTTLLDRAPDSGSYFISAQDIPELPWPTSLFFIAAVVVTVCFLHTRWFMKDVQRC